jgi:hypothetical protein
MKQIKTEYVPYWNASTKMIRFAIPIRSFAANLRHRRISLSFYRTCQKTGKKADSAVWLHSSQEKKVERSRIVIVLLFGFISEQKTQSFRNETHFRCFFPC